MTKFSKINILNDYDYPLLYMCFLSDGGAEV
jgi:hypothetical protein